MSRDDLRASSPTETPHYTNAHRALLQSFLSRPIQTVDALKPTLAAILTAQNPSRPTLPGDITPSTLPPLLTTLNTKLAPLDYELRPTRSQSPSRTQLYALVNTSSDAFTQLATSFTPDEIAYVKRLLDAIFIENDTRGKEVLAVNTMRAKQLAKAPPRQSQRRRKEEEGPVVNSIKIEAAERVVEALISQSFLSRSRGNYISLAPRGVLELRGYLKEMYNEEGDGGVVRIRDCYGCAEIVTVGVRCGERGCGCRLHEQCAVGVLRGEARRRCPVCKGGWGGEWVGEKAATAGGGGRRGTRGRGEELEEEEEEDE
ncbi:hypothetical protein EJ04DRAFT_497962 [Polyplosphaeria fusca]|uniref:Non-structural maintenance of chromosomes element 1 homolog n=1 Tax=Polyplosphaeria fusca TaxID=682080 RepID=A0A9P4UYX5_9PLEO|nr:hypothetical protein EJ04DRAFT_497962 [Polyplosphaeria fusca]